MMKTETTGHHLISRLGCVDFKARELLKEEKEEVASF